LPLLDVTDVFQIEVPDGWGTTAVVGREYTLSSGDDTGQRIDIVVYQARTKKDALPELSTAAVRAWAKGIGMHDSESLTVMTPGGSTRRAFASIRGDVRDVFVGFFYFKKSFVVAAGSAPSDDRGGFAHIERMLWSIEAA
jgi:type IV pilus biogenesis protein CpaD/CtpE